uniref:Uncharacterized protein n=1 Tax=Avena sativa TaxID=4498 RepID=A0ACD5YVE4_AVESA
MLVSDLSEGLLEEILRRLPPGEPGCLFRASVVCKPWRSLVTSSGFGSRYRELHGTPPLLGFFEIDDVFGCWFAPSTPISPFPPIHPDPRDFFVLDSRHGLVLLRTPGWKNEEPVARFIVWDPVSRRQWEFPPPEFAANILYDNAVVLCSADRLSCPGCPFTVVYVGTDGPGIPHASVFSSETRAWSSVATIPDVPPNTEIRRCGSKALVGNVLYFSCYHDIILRYDLSSRELSVMDWPPMDPGHDSVLMKTDEGVLGCTMIQESEFCFCSMETGPDGAVAWSQPRFVELEEQLLPSRPFDVIGFVDGPDVFYLRAGSCIFTAELKSGRVKKIPINRFSVIANFTLIPYMSFYTPDLAGPRTLPSTMASSSNNAEPDPDKYHDSLLLHSSGQVGDEQGNGQEGDGWEEVSAEKECDKEKEKAAQELFDMGSKAIDELDFVCAVDCLRHALKIRVSHHGKLSPKCVSTYFHYGRALGCKTLLNTTYSSKDLHLPWRMFHVARSILENNLSSIMDKVDTFFALVHVSMQGEDIDYSLIVCFKALAILEHLVEPDHRLIFDLNLQIRFAFELESKIGDAHAISLCKSRIENLKRANEDFLSDKAYDASATELGSFSLPKYIEFFTGKLLSAMEKKLEDLELAISSPVSEASGDQNVDGDVPRTVSLTSQFSGASNAMSTAATIGTTGSTREDLEATGRGIKRANVEQISSEPSPKKFAEGSPSVEVDSSNSSDAESDGSVSE